jgi:uncharacterized membrane protein
MAACGSKENLEMATTNPNLHLEYVGMIVEIAGIAAIVAGVVLSLHHWPAAVALIGGGVAYVVGKTLRAE